MQLKRAEPIRATLTAFTAALLGTSVGARAADPGKVDSSLLIYNEVNRVSAVEGVIDLTRPVSDRRTYSLRLTLDALTGASPNGATPSSHVQSFTGASGTVGFTAPAGTIPLDNTFSDRRLGVDGTLIESLDRLTVFTVGGHLSFERDYSSLGVNGGITRDVNRRNTTLGISGSYSHDTVSPIGGAPTPLSSMPAPTPSTGGEGEGEGEGGGGGGPGQGKDIEGIIASLSQVLGRQTLLAANYSFEHSSGYLTDPYKLLSVVQDETSATPGEPADYLYENRPGGRSMQALYGELRRYIAGVTADVSYRYFWDDWGITSHAVDVLTRVPVTHGHALEPHVRWYRQSAADFYQTYLVQGDQVPQFASADSRLAAFDAWTYGLKYSLPVHENDALGFSAEYYTQKGTRGPPNPIGILGQYDLFPALDVFMFRVGFSHGF